MIAAPGENNCPALKLEYIIYLDRLWYANCQVCARIYQQITRGFLGQSVVNELSIFDCLENISYVFLLLQAGLEGGRIICLRRRKPR